MKIKIQEGEKSRYVEVAFPSILKAWIVSMLVYTGTLVGIGLLLMLILE